MSIHHTLIPQNYLLQNSFFHTSPEFNDFGWHGMAGPGSSCAMGISLAICQGSMVMAGSLLGPIKGLDQAWQTGLHSDPCWGPQACWLSRGLWHRLLCPHPTNLPFLTSAVLTLLPPPPEAGAHCDPWPEGSRPRPYMDCADSVTPLSPPLLQTPNKSLLRALQMSSSLSLILASRKVDHWS